MVKLTDFGFSNKFTPGQQLETSCGSLAYSAPEILLGDAYDAPAVDIWSLGVILYMLLCGRLPFQEANDSETLTKILDCQYVLPDHLSHHANLISRMLVKDPKKRATLQEIITNPWVAAGERGLAQILPLVGKANLSDSAHATIIEQMVAGGVDTEERILSSLENNDYSYATATYYLLAERVLASYREEKAREVLSAERNDSASLSSNVIKCRSRSNSWRIARRPCAIVKEEKFYIFIKYSRSGSREGISPLAIQGLLEFSRMNLAEGRRRAASPDSRSSRSPSPPGSTGRNSPGMLFYIWLQFDHRVDCFFKLQATSESGASSKNDISTYNKVRMIRPRQAVVSPDMALRYERHRLASSRTHRSTSCSSSETSDDDSSERRMNLLVSRCCRCSNDVHGNNDDTSGGKISFAF
uniref:Protein kinase domain-containing protein n=1 Tax=Syphacia muris TaxID=451379 RepID=A0A0N5AW13_9BILA